MSMKQDMLKVVRKVIEDVKPDTAVKKAIQALSLNTGRTIMIAIGKAAWQMGNVAACELNDKLNEGYVITKYQHVISAIPHTKCMEAGHPIPDINAIKTANTVIEAVSHLKEDDNVIVLISGGGSALFEKPLIPLVELEEITNQLLRCGASIQEINIIRKKLSAVKGGKFAKLCEPANVYSIILSDVLGDPLDIIASGPTVTDTSGNIDAIDIITKYGVDISDETINIIKEQNKCIVTNNQSIIVGSVKLLCQSAESELRRLGYKTIILTDEINAEAKEVGKTMAAIARYHIRAEIGNPIAYIVGGETVVNVHGSGLGGRNQELVFSAASRLKGLNNVLLFSIGSDGTDGPTDAAGGFVDGHTAEVVESKGMSVDKYLAENDTYHGLELAKGLIKTGATGTNVNDLTVLLLN